MDKLCIICRNSEIQGSLYMLSAFENYEEICAVLNLNPDALPSYYRICDKHFTKTRRINRKKTRPCGIPTKYMEGYTVYKPSIAANPSTSSAAQTAQMQIAFEDVERPSTSSAAQTAQMQIAFEDVERPSTSQTVPNLANTCQILVPYNPNNGSSSSSSPLPLVPSRAPQYQGEIYEALQRYYRVGNRNYIFNRLGPPVHIILPHAAERIPQQGISQRMRDFLAYFGSSLQEI
ncbi:uncharacterized protein LOC142225381 [Haematobia irritans]|uniref:uncharacterized protein LOC142225381 n=1 Tax=Haematobia irritans TaxID=7368 RepID=UPI003F4F9702